MSSVGQALGGIIGAVAGFIIGGPAGGLKGALYGAQIGMTIGGIIDPPAGPKIQGPRLDDLTVQTSTYGAFLPRPYGTIATTGNVFWLENDKLKEVARTESQGGKGGGGGSEVTTYSYYATFAVSLADVGDTPITGVRRIWIGSKLFYDGGSTSVSTLMASTLNGAKFKFYNGSETQTPDPRIQADKGINNTPAYRGVAYIVFYDLPLKDWQNNLMSAQVKVELVAAGSVAPRLEHRGSVATANATTGSQSIVVRGNYAYVVGSTGDKLEIFNIVNIDAPILVGSVAATSSNGEICLNEAGTLIYAGSSNLEAFNVTDPAAPFSAGVLSTASSITGLAFYGGYLYAIFSGAGNNFLRVYGALGQVSLDIAIRASSADIYITADRLYIVNAGIGGDRFLSIYDVAATPTAPALLGEVAINDAASDVVVAGNYAYVAASTFQIVNVSNPAVPVVTGQISPNAFRGLAIEGNYLFAGESAAGMLRIYSLTNPAVPALVASVTVDSGGFLPSDIAVQNGIVYLANQRTPLRTVFFNGAVISSSGVTLSAIVRAECLSSKLLADADVDATALTSSVRGYRISSLGAIRGGLEPLQGAWPFDAVSSGYKIKFVPRGQASVATISSDKLDARAAGSEPGVQITGAREMDIVLPRKVSLKYFDLAREYDTNEQSAERLNTDAVHVREIEMALVLTDNEALQKVEILRDLYWLERHDVSFSLPPEYNALEPADVIILTSPAATYELRLTQTDYTSDGRLECKAKYNRAATYASTAPGASGQPSEGVLELAGPTLYELLDIPLVQDVYDTPGFPLAMSGYLSGWPGGVLYRSEDGGQLWTDVQTLTPPGATIGWALNTLSVHDGRLLDKAGRLGVTFNGSAPASVTELQMFNGANHFAYGVDGRWEIIAAQNCVLQADGSYALSDFMRGRFGTEWASGVHANGDRLILLSSAQLRFMTVSSNSIGLERLYRGVTAGDALDSDTDRAFTYRGVNLECLSPVYLNGNRHPSTNDWTLTWIRRGRVGAEWRDLIDVPLGEASEAYEMDIFDGAGYATVKRTLAAATPSVPYTSAQQVTDFGANQATLYTKTYQLSASVGRGYPLTASITR